MATLLAYEEFVDFLAGGVRPEDLVAYEPSDTVRNRVADLVAREKTAGLAADEANELDCYVQLEHVMRMAKARARLPLVHE